MITETTRDNALIAAANGKVSMVIYQKNGHPEYANLTQILGEVLSGHGNIYVADVEPLKAPEPEKPPKKESRLTKVRDKAEFIEETTRGRKSDVDDGKLSALYKGHWSISQMADEFGVTERTIQNHLKVLEEEGRL